MTERMNEKSTNGSGLRRKKYLRMNQAVDQEKKKDSRKSDNGREKKSNIQDKKTINIFSVV